MGKETYISLTDLAKFYNSEDPSGIIRNWMSNKDSFLFYSLWEEIHNENFNSVELHRIKKEEVGLNRFTMTPKQWRKTSNAILIEQNLFQKERLIQLNQMAKSQLTVLSHHKPKYFIDKK